MGFLKKLFGGGSSGGSGGKKGFYLYIKMRRSGEIVPVRINPTYELSRDDDGVLFTRKLVTGTKSFERAEAEFYFSDNYSIKSADISGGELVEEDAYNAQQAAQTSSE